MGKKQVVLITLFAFFFSLVLPCETRAVTSEEGRSCLSPLLQIKRLSNQVLFREETVSRAKDLLFEQQKMKNLTSFEEKARLQGIKEKININLQPVALDEEVYNFEQELKRKGYAGGKSLLHNAKAIMSIYEYLAILPDIKNENGYSLGLSDYFHLYQALSNISGLESWLFAHIHLFGDINDRTDEFLEKITSDNKPIVFFVPHNVFSHKRARTTASEIQWFISHPERMRNVYFVFGAYNIILEQEYINSPFSLVHKNPLSDAESMQLMEEILLNHEYFKGGSNFLNASAVSALSHQAEQRHDETIIGQSI